MGLSRDGVGVFLGGDEVRVSLQVVWERDCY